MLRDGLEHNMYIQRDQTCSGQFTCGQCQASGRLTGWPARAQKRTNTIFSVLFESESSECFLFFNLFRALYHLKKEREVCTSE